MAKRPSAFEYPAFHAGPRICLGMNMAMLEVRMFVAVMVRHFYVRIQDGEKVENCGYILASTLVMKGRLPLQFSQRAMAPSA
uniref:Cytochrome P450 n=1 Tax=Globisporangium ultimum (strain ATCC 200006 / CBS 805.95 / DAOM BR144) TaxID=431595 RepID=K3X3L0_GLOUD